MYFPWHTVEAALSIFNLSFVVKNNKLSNDVYLEKCFRQFNRSSLILLISSTIGSQTFSVRGAFGVSAIFYGAPRGKKTDTSFLLSS